MPLHPTKKQIDDEAKNLVPANDTVDGRAPESVRTAVEDLIYRFPGTATYPKYSPGRYPNLAARLAALSGRRAQTLMAAYKKFLEEADGVDPVEIQGLIETKPKENQLGWLACMVSQLGPPSVAASSSSFAAVNAPRLCPVCCSATCAGHPGGPYGC